MFFAKRIFSVSILVASGLFAAAGSAQAQLAPGCVCPPNSIQSGNQCASTLPGPLTYVAPVCAPGAGASSGQSYTSDLKARINRATAMSFPNASTASADQAVGGIFSPGGGGTSLPGAPRFNLGMYVAPPSGDTNGVTLGGGGYSLRNTGYGISDRQGFIAPGTTTPGFRETGGSGGVTGTYDASHLVGSGQKLLLSATYDFTSTRAEFGPIPALGVGVNSGIVRSDVSQIGGTALYTNQTFYLMGKGSYGFGRGNETQAAAAGGAFGSYSIEGYTADLTAGNVFMLVNTTQAVAPKAIRYAKAPAVATYDGGYAIGLDLSGRVGYQGTRANGFTDSAGFLFGREQVEFGDVGMKAKLIGSVPRNGVTWLPYIAGTLNYQYDYRHTAFIPAQAALLTGDLINFTQGRTSAGGQVGLDVRMQSGWIVGLNGFYAASSDTTVAGGRAFLRVPFGPTAVVARY